MHAKSENNLKLTRSDQANVGDSSEFGTKFALEERRDHPTQRTNLLERGLELFDYCFE